MTARHRRVSIAVFEASLLLREQGWIVSRWSVDHSPPDLFAARKAEILLVMVRYMRGPVLDAREVSDAFGSELERLCSIGNPRFVRKEAWVLALHGVWTRYEVLPGGIRRIWNRPDEMTATGRQVKECRVTEETDYETDRGIPASLAIGGGRKRSRAEARP